MVLYFNDFLLFLSLCLFILALLFFIKLLICLTPVEIGSLGAAQILATELIYRLVDGIVIKVRPTICLEVINAGASLAIWMGADAAAFKVTARLAPKEMRLRNPNMISEHKWMQNTVKT